MKSRWLLEPFLTGLILVAVYAAWQISYVLSSAADGRVPGESQLMGQELVVATTVGILLVAAPVAVWIVLSSLANLIVKKRGFPARAFMGFIAALAVCAPFAIYFAIQLTESRGWSGLAAITVAIPVIIPVLVVATYCAVGAMLALVESWRARRPSRGTSK